MVPTKQMVLDAARFYLGDDLVAGGQDFTNTALEQPFQMSLRELYRAMQGVANPRVQRTVFYDLPANTSFLSPATAGITDLGEIEAVEERGNLTSVAITNAASGSGFITVTAAGHPFINGDQAVVFGILGIVGANGMFAVTYSDPSTFLLNGAVGIGTYTAATGTATKSGDQFVPLTQVNRIEQVSNSNPVLGSVSWEEDSLRFPPCSGIRELRIVYISSAATVSGSTDTTGIDDSIDFLAIRTAGLAASSRGARDRASELNTMALGPTMQADATGGILRELLQTGVRALQCTPTQRPPYRLRVNQDVNYLL
jgi:hypothetical protein